MTNSTMLLVVYWEYILIPRLLLILAMGQVRKMINNSLETGSQPTATACNATHDTAWRKPSTHLSIKRIDCDKTKETCVQILIPHERTFILVFRHEEWLVGDDPILKFRAKLTPFEQRMLFNQYSLVAPRLYLAKTDPHSSHTISLWQLNFLYY